MDMPSILLIALSLAMDAFSVSVTSGITGGKIRYFNVLKMGFSFGLFQFFMPVLGWLAGSTFRIYIVTIDHWIAFSLLSFVGVRMIWESLKDEHQTIDPFDNKTLLLLSISTSIDAFAVGISFSFLDVSIFFPVLIIGIITFLLSSAGILMGNGLRHFFEKFNVEIIGGLILIGIGLKILIEHLIE
ncbi:MAG TPA: manganese efflux pump MntP family protein [bacterium]|nr:manganese efflux pump MntP family protein [bacterium]